MRPPVFRGVLDPSELTIGSLFSGIAGLELGILAEVQTAKVIWQAECDPHARVVLERWFPGVRRYNDVKEIDETAERPDVICGGFPCQDISDAGKQAGIDGPRSGLWSEFARIVRVLRPRFVFVENVAALAIRGLDRVLGDLAAVGFDAEWESFRASDVGAPHRRDRIFILAYANGSRWRPDERIAIGSDGREEVRGWTPELGRRSGSLANPERDGLQGSCDEISWQGEVTRGRRPTNACESILADASGSRRTVAQDAGAGGCDEGARAQAYGRRTSGGEQPERDRGGPLADAHGDGRESLGLGGILDGERSPSGDDTDGRHGAHRFPPGPAAIAGWDGPQPAIRRGDDGVPGRSHRLRLLGNSVVQQQAAIAWRTLIGRAANTRTSGAERTA